MFLAAFIKTLLRLTPAGVGAIVAINAVLLFRNIELFRIWWLIPIQILCFWVLVLLVTPIEYYKLSSHKK